MAGLFGTEGVRGVANFELTPDLAFRLAQACAVSLVKEGNTPARVLIGKDTRISGDMLEASLSAGFCSMGVQVVSIGIIPTPALAYLVRKYKMDVGVMISASREPAEYNGIKFFDANGRRLTDGTEKLIEEYAIGKRDITPFLKSGNAVGRISYSHTALRDYVDYVRKICNADFSGMKIAIDCANGAAYQCAKLLFKELGADVETVNNVPDGVNINYNCGLLNPVGLTNFVVSHRCTFGLIFDGDADRVLAVDENGNLIDGDEIFAICAENLRISGKLCCNTVAATVSENSGFADMLGNLGIKCVHTPDGERDVLDVMVQNGYSIGGDSSGHIIFSDYNSTGDGLVTAVQLAEALCRSGMGRMSELVAHIKSDI